MYACIMGCKDSVEALPSLPKGKKKNNPILVYISLATPNTTPTFKEKPFYARARAAPLLTFRDVVCVPNLAALSPFPGAETHFRFVGCLMPLPWNAHIPRPPLLSIV